MKRLVSEKKLKYKAWCHTNITAEENEMAKKSVAKYSTKRERNNLERNLIYEERVEICVQDKQLAKERRDVDGYRWNKYMEHLLKVENIWDRMVECGIVQV